MKENHLKSENAIAKATAGITGRNMLRSGARFSKVPKTFLARKAIREPTNRLFRKADLLTCFEDNKKQTDRVVWRLKSPPFLIYRGNRDTRK